jgi:beta-lactamase regulating signal transducer with metallopeptidase domain
MDVIELLSLLAIRLHALSENYIFINPEKYDWDTYSQIILHEKIHIQQGHSYDIMLAELALIFQWFNPFAWFYRKAMEDNLEFLTDNELLEHSDVERPAIR